MASPVENKKRKVSCMAITIRPLGGLGNQLFVYATGATLAKKLDTELVADLTLPSEKSGP